MIAAFIIAACVLLLVLGIVGVWNAGCAYGDKRRLQQFRAHAMVADELFAQRQKRKGRSA